MKKNWFKKPLPSFCTSNFDVIKAIFLYVKKKKYPVLLECTSNQVNQFGGYTGLNPREFNKKVKSLNSEIKIRKENIILGADHLGPLPWKNFDKKKAFLNAKQLLRLIVKENFTKIHLDTTIKCRNDKNLNLEEIRSRFLELFNIIPKRKLNKIYFVAGSEVPFAGGGDFNQNISKLEDIKNDYLIYDSAINFNKSQKEFALVIEPGMSFTNNKVFKPKIKNLKKIIKFSRKKRIFFEAHSTDYQKMNVLKKLVKANFKFLKVGPELTFKYHDSLKFMLNLEKKIIPKNDLSKLNENLKKIMNKNKKYWKSYYKGSISKINYLKFNSKLDRIRYYWSDKLIEKSKKKLFKNICKIPRNFIINKLKIENDTQNNNTININNNVDLIVNYFLESTLNRYYEACGFK